MNHNGRVPTIATVICFASTGFSQPRSLTENQSGQITRPEIVIACSFQDSSRGLSDESPSRDHPKRATKVPEYGFWPTPLMIDRIIDRITEEMAGNYTMDEDQRERTAAIFRSKLVPFFMENRAEIQTLVNEFFEVQLNKEAPTSEMVAEWSQRVMPILRDFESVVDNVTDDMREYFTDDQVTKMEGELAAIKTGFTLANNKLGSWAAGKYDPEVEWFTPGPAREKREREQAEEMDRAMRDAQEQAEARAREAENATRLEVGGVAVQPMPADPARKAVSQPVVKDEWTLYTEDFIRRYELEPEQEQKAREFLRARQVERDRYLQKKAADIARVTQAAADATDEEKRKHSKEEADRLEAPVSRMFQQLRDKLNTLPTRAQRARAEPPAGSAPAERAPATNSATNPVTTNER